MKNEKVLKVNTRRIIAIAWAIVCVGIAFMQPVFTTWFMFRLCVCGGFIFGMIWPGHFGVVDEGENANDA